MAHFAELNSDNVVLRIIVLENQYPEDEDSYVQFLKELYGEDTIWKQCSYNAKIRKHYPAPGFTYDAVRDAFIPPQPPGPHILDDSTCTWRLLPAPIEELLAQIKNQQK